MTVIHIQLFVLHMCMWREREGYGNAGVGAGGGVVAVSEWCECMGGTRVSGAVSSADDLIEISVVRGMRDVCGVCEMCMRLAWGGVGGVVSG